MDIYDEFVGVVTTLQAAQIEFAVCGGFALALHGLPRYTKDIDLLIRAEDAEKAVEAVKAAGFEYDAGTMQFGVHARYPQDVRRVNKIVDKQLLTLDLLIVNAALDGVWAQRCLYEYRGLRIHAVSAIGLAKMKRIAGRSQDLVDIERLGFRTDDPTIQPE